MIRFSDLWDNLIYEECYVKITTKKDLRKFAEIAGYHSSDQGTYIEFLAKYGVTQGQYFSFYNFIHSLSTRHYAASRKTGGYQTYNIADEIRNTFYVTDIDTKSSYGDNYIAVTLVL